MRNPSPRQTHDARRTIERVPLTLSPREWKRAREPPLAGMGFSGMFTFIGSYLTSVAATIASYTGPGCNPITGGSCCKAYSPGLVVPLVGPWSALQNDSKADPRERPADAFGVDVACGLLEATALVAMAVGFVYHPRAWLSMAPSASGASLAIAW